jgi:hypothetical protein
VVVDIEEEAGEDGREAKDSDENIATEYTKTQGVDSRAADPIESESGAVGAGTAPKKGSADLQADSEEVTGSALGAKVPLAEDDKPEEEVPPPINPAKSAAPAKEEEDGFASEDTGMLENVLLDNSSAAPVAQPGADGSSAASFDFESE